MKLSGVAHKAFERNYKQKATSRIDLPTDEMTDFYRDTFDEEFQSEEVILDEGDTLGGLKDIGTAAVKEHHAKIAPTVMPQSAETVEEKITLPFGKADFSYDLMAIIDVTDDAGRIRDNKIIGKTPNQDDLDKDIQLSTYSLVKRMQTKVAEPELRLDAVIKNKVPKAVSLKTQRTVEGLRLHLNTIGHIAKQIRAEAFPRNPTGWWCSPKFCGYWNLCMGKGAVQVDLAPTANLDSQLKESIAKVEEVKTDEPTQ